MKKRYFILTLSVIFATGALSVFSSGNGIPATTYAPVKEIMYYQDYETYTESGDLNTIDATSGGKCLKLSYTVAGAQQETYNMPSTITDDDVEISFKILPEKTDEAVARFYIQFLNGSSVSLQLQFDATANTSYYGLYVSNTELIPRMDLNHIPYGAQTFTADDFNIIKIILKRERDNENTATGGKMDVYLNDVAKHPPGGFDITAIGSGCKFKDNPINRIRMYYISSSGYNPTQTMYVDDISVISTKQIAYNCDELSMDFESSMDYSSEISKLIVNGTDSLYLQQNISFSLIKADDDTDITELNGVVAAKANDGTAVFSFSEDVDVSSGWYYVDVKRYINGEAKGAGKRQKLYVATAEQLSDLPGDFSNLPENMTEAAAKVEYYLPCFLTEEEIEELIPSANAELAAENLLFITKYFQSNSTIFTTIAEVQYSFNKAKTYLRIKNAKDDAALRSILKSGGYLNLYDGNTVLIEKEKEFFAHFNTKRCDGENPLLTDEDVNAALNYSMALTLLNNAKRSDIKKIVHDYNNVFKLNLEAASGLNEDKLYAALYNKSYMTVLDIQNDWAEKIKDLAAEPAGADENKEKEIVRQPFGKSSIRISPVEASLPVIDNAEISKVPFSDISGHWAEETILLMQQKNIIIGYEDGRFCPDQTLTRAEFANMLAQVLPIGTAKGGIAFADVAQSDWFYEAVAKMAAIGVVQGADGMFMPNAPITREELAVMVYRALGVTEEIPKSIRFVDAKEISEYAQEAINALVARGILLGFEDNTLRPQRLTSRAEAIKLLSVVLSSLFE